MLSFILGLTWGIVIGVYWKTKTKPRHEPKDKLDQAFIDLGIVKEEKGSFIEVNRVEQYLKENKGEIPLGDIIQDDE